MTERLYYTDSYLTEFEAMVVGHGEGGRLYLDRSAFYPTSGGQAFDRGALQVRAEGAPSLTVLDVVDEGEQIAHVLSPGEAQQVRDGERVVGHIDWSRRFDHMQQHSGQHLLSAVFQELLGLATTSVHFGAETSTLDLDAAALAPEQLCAVEQRANTVVFENRAFSVDLEAAAEGLRKQSTRTGPLRVVSIASLDRSACGGTHVARTGEIGAVLLRKLERIRKAVRVEFVCGGRATRRARADYDSLTRLGGLLSTSVDDVAEVMSKRLADLARDSAALRAAREQLDEYRARDLYARARAESGPRLALHVERLPPGGSLQELRGLAQAYAANERAVLVAVLEQPASLLLASSADSGVDAGAVLKAALARGGGRGGGSARLAQGTVADVPSLDAALKDVEAQLAAATERG